MSPLDWPNLAYAFLIRLLALLAVALLVAACNQQDSEVTGAVDSCARNMFPSYNPKNYDQCVAVCKACERGVTTTCTTSCTLKGAR